MKNLKTYSLLSVIFFYLVSCQKEKKPNALKSPEETIVSVAKKPNPNYQYNQKTFNLYGKIKSVKCTTFKQFIPISEISNYVTKIDLEVDEKGNIVKETMYLENNYLNYIHQNFYDDMNNRIKKISYNEKDEIVYIENITLNEQGLIVSEESVVPGNYKMSYLNTYDYEIVSDSLILYHYNSTSHTYSDKAKVVEKYKNDNLISKTEYEDGTITNLTLYEYDSNNNLLVDNEEIGHDYYEYKYDENNRVVYEQFWYDITKDMLEKKMTYDINGNVIREEHYADGQLDKKSSYKDEFEYDKKKNWVRRTRYKLNGTKISFLERKIQYYMN